VAESELVATSLQIRRFSHKTGFQSGGLTSWQQTQQDILTGGSHGFSGAGSQVRGKSSFRTIAAGSQPESGVSANTQEQTATVMNTKGIVIHRFIIYSSWLIERVSNRGLL